MGKPGEIALLAEKTSSAKLKLVSVLGRGKCSGAAAATGWKGRIGGARGRLERIGLLRFGPAEPKALGFCFALRKLAIKPKFWL